MKVNLVAFCLLIGSVCYGQQPSTYYHQLHGTFQDPNGHAIAGLRIQLVHQGKVVRWATTNVNGDFAIETIASNDYLITIDPESLYSFRAFIKIVEKGPNPDNVVFTVDPSKSCCTSAAGTPFPKLLSFPKPAYPPAAVAVRATGEVIVAVKIGRDGTVTSAQVQAGHLLLRAPAETAARKALFEPSEMAEREARLSYVYLANDNVREGVSQYANPYRTQIVWVAGIDF